MAAIIIHEAVLEDAGDILKLQKTAFQSEAELYDNFNIPPLTQTLPEIEDEFKKRVFIKASLEGKLAGSVRAHMENGVCHIGRLIVDPALQRRGIGARLMQAIEKRFDSAKLYEVFTGHKSEVNLALYAKLGYRRTRERKAGDSLNLVFLAKHKQG